MTRPGPMRRFTQILLAAAVLSCGGDGGVTIDDVVTVTVSPGTATLNSIGATTQLSASSSSGATTFTWNSSTASVATVSSTGLVTAMANGTTTITASVGSATSSGATVTVVQTVASIGLTPATGTLTAGQTLQLTATVEDAGGTAVTPALSWTSSDESIATVSSEGLVTGVDDGSTVISATQDGVSGTADVDVIRDDFMPTGELTLDGTVEAAEVMIPVDVTVTLTGAVAINATGPVTIAGNITGDCTALEVRGQDAVTISGTLNNVCVAEPEAEPAPLDIVSGAVLTLDDATITSSGDISIANTDPAALAPPDGALARTSQADPEISLVGTTIEIQPSVAAAGEDVIESAAAAGPGTARLAAPVMGGAGTNDKGLNLNPAGLIFVGETVLRSQSGGAGGAATGIHATGGVGGNGGDVFIQFQTGNRGLEVRGDPPFTINVSRGDGGPGGPATATAPVDVGPDRATSVTAVGGKGGVAGILLTLLDDALFNIDGGFGGPGGSATATAPDGVSATIRALAQHGGNATATGGAGAPGSGDFGEFGGGGGGGGPATATAGKGGDGSDFEGQSKDAADGW